METLWNIQAAHLRDGIGLGKDFSVANTRSTSPSEFSMGTSPGTESRTQSCWRTFNQYYSFYLTRDGSEIFQLQYLNFLDILQLAMQCFQFKW